MKRFTIVLALLSLPFIAGCMHHGHYYIRPIRNTLAQNLSRECRTAVTIGTKPKKNI